MTWVDRVIDVIDPWADAVLGFPIERIVAPILLLVLAWAWTGGPDNPDWPRRRKGEL